MLRITVRAPIRPTEDPAKVKLAIEKLFPGAAVELHPDEAVASAPSLARLEELIRSYQIPDTARGVMLGGLSADGRRATFWLGKQAAAVGRAHFGALRAPLGDIMVHLEGDADFDVERLIYATAPDTTCAPEFAMVPPLLRPQP